MMTDSIQTFEPSGWLHEDQVDLPEETRSDVVRRRSVLYDSMRNVEMAIARPSSLPGWREGLMNALAPLESALEEHVAEVEGDGGLFDEVVQREPRLAHMIDDLTEGHVLLGEACRHAIDAIGDRSTDDNVVRQRVNLVLLRLARHRQRGSELIYEAYSTDIATGD